MPKLNHWKAAQERILAGTSPIEHILCYGTSHTQAAPPSTKSTGYPDQLAALLTAGGIPCSTNSWWGIKTAGAVASGATAYNPSLSFAGSWAPGTTGFGVAAPKSSSSGATCAFVASGSTDTIVIAYRLNTSGGSFNVDAGSGAIGSAVVTSGTAGQLQTVTKTAALGSHTWTITTTSTSAVEIVGAYAYDSTTPTFMMHNGGAFGFVASAVAGSAFSDVITAINPCVGFAECITNDASAGTAVGSYTTNLTSIINALPKDKVMLTDPPSRDASILITTQDKYTHVARSVAWDLNVPIIDTYAAMAGGWATWNSVGIYLDDIHLNTTGKGYVAADAYALLRAA